MFVSLGCRLHKRHMQWFSSILHEDSLQLKRWPSIERLVWDWEEVGGYNAQQLRPPVALHVESTKCADKCCLARLGGVDVEEATSETPNAIEAMQLNVSLIFVFCILGKVVCAAVFLLVT